MFTTGRIVFAILFIIAFITLMIYAYGKDKKNHQAYYKNAAKKVLIYGSIVVVLFILFRFFTSK